VSRDDTHRYLIAYDIPDDRRRDRLAKCLQRHGDRIQFSVFVVDASPARLVRLEAEVRSIALLTEDSVLICDLGVSKSVEDTRFRTLGRSRRITPSGSVVL
jgi:CRISPR-associated protein Cas2